MSAFGTTQCKATGVRGHIKIVNWPIAPSPAQSFKAFDFLVFDANNAAIAGCAAGSRIGAVSTNQNRVIGRALSDALDENGAARTRVGVIVACPNCEFEMPVDHATPSSAVLIPTSQLMTSYEIKNVNTNGGYYAISLDNTSNPKGTIMDFNEEDLPTWPDATTTGTTQYARAWFEFSPAYGFSGVVS